MATEITDDYFKFGEMKYFRGNAHILQLVTYGEKKDPVGPKAYVDPQNTVNPEYLKGRVQSDTVAIINWSETDKATVEVNGSLTYFGLNGKVEAGGTYEKVKSANLRLVNFFIAEGPLTAMLNNEADGARKYLADEGNDGRILSEVWVGMEDELADHFGTYANGSLSVSAAGGNAQISVTGGKHGTQTITISPGTTFAYKLHKVKDWNKDKTHIDNMEADYKGMG